MAKLIVNPTSPSRREVVLSRSLLSIGRDPSNDVVLPDAMVSRRHAVIEYRGSQYFLRDCNSSNGSLVNGDRVSERGLRDGDLVAIGTARLLFRDDLVAEDAAGKVIHHPSAPRQQCPSCQRDYRKGDVFCRHCGASLAPAPAARTICSACGTAVPLPARFCTACGARLGEAQEGAAEDERAAALAGGGAEAAAEPPREAVDAAPPDAVAEARPQQAGPRSSLESTAEQEPLPPAPAARLEPPRPVTPAPAPLPSTLTPQPAPLSSVTAPAAIATEPPRDSAPGAAGPGEPVAVPAPFAPASPVARLAAALVDAAIVGAGQLVLWLPALLYWMSGATPSVDPAEQEVSFLPILLSVSLAALAVILGAVYYVYFWGVRGATPGKRLLGLVVQGQDGRQPIGPGRAVLRLLGYGVSGLVFGIGFLMIAFGGSGLHDQIAGTRVVRRQGA